MAERQTYTRQFTQTAMPQETGETQAIINTAQATAAVLIQQKEKQDQLKINNFSSQADLTMLQKTNEFRAKHAEDPMNPEAKQKLDQEYDKIFTAYDKDLGIGSQGKWRQTKDVMKAQYAESNAKWVMAQNVKNAETNLSKGKDLSLTMMYEKGKEGDMDGAFNLIKLKGEQLRNDVDGIMPTTEINAMMENFESDGAKRFLMGMIERDPDTAYEMLKDERITKAIDSDEAVEVLDKMISRQQKDIKIKQQQNQFVAQGSFAKDTEDMSTGQKLVALESGDYDKAWAKSMKSRILSSKGLTPEKRQDVLAKFIQRQSYLTHGITDSGNLTGQTYLREASKLQTDLNNAVARGEIDQKEADKAEVTLMKSSGKAVGKIDMKQTWFAYKQNDAYDDIKKKLKGESQFMATIDLFNGTDEKTSEDELKKKTTEIINKYNQKSIDAQVQTVKLKAISTGETREFPMDRYNKLTDAQKKEFEVING